MVPRRVGFLVNPVAGMGARVGLKGTDGVLDEAVRRGARPVAQERALAFLSALRSGPAWVTAAGAMGEDALAEAGHSAMVVYSPASAATDGADSRAAAAAIRDAGVDIVVFVGGDGTAADVASGVGESVPALGVPSGSKMYSAVFADTPAAAARVVGQGFDETAPQDVLDVDERAYRDGDLRVALRARLAVPRHHAVQGGKSAGADDEVEQESLALAVAESLRPGVTYVLGAGGTMMGVKRAIGVGGTLLGIDAVRDGRLVARDAGEADILALPGPVVVVVSPIGRQGFVLGRGNLPISPSVLRRTDGPGALVVVATPTKLLETTEIKVDSGDAAFDARFPPFLRVLTGFGASKLVRVRR